MTALEVISRIEIKGKNVPEMLDHIVFEDKGAKDALEKLKEKYLDIFVNLLCSLVYSDELVDEDRYGYATVGRSALEIIDEVWEEMGEEFEKDAENIKELLQTLIDIEVYCVSFDGDKVIAG
jgi:hypothetical protein